MRQTVNLPKLGETVDEVLVLEWFRDVGEEVVEGDPLMQVETDKVETEVPSPVTGVLVEHLVKVEDEVATGAPICVIEIA